MSLVTNIINFATRVGTEIKGLRTLINGNAVDLSALTTTNKANLVAALNEIVASVGQAAASGGAQINDTAASSTQTYSSSKIASLVSQATSDLVNGSPAALDTLKELSDALAGDANFAATTATALGNRVRVDAAQTFTTPQQTQALSNIGAASATSVGDTTTDFVATFVTALA